MLELNIQFIDKMILTPTETNLFAYWYNFFNLLRSFFEIDTNLGLEPILIKKLLIILDNIFLKVYMQKDLHISFGIK